jgi:hypothetical protein
MNTTSEIKSLLLWEDQELKKKLLASDVFLKKELQDIKHGTERRLDLLFLQLVVKLRIFSIETSEMETLFHEFLSEMEIQIRSISHEHMHSKDVILGITKYWPIRYICNSFQNVKNRLNILDNKIRLNQMKAFLYICELNIRVLEKYYKELGMSNRVMELYVYRMDINRDRYFYRGNYGLFIWYSIFRSISNYGTSFVRLAVTCTLSVILFGSVYWLADYFAPGNLRMIADLGDYSSYFFNSLVTISGLWIDASPQTALQRVAMGINTVYGMVVFGMLFNVISTKLSMNN